MPGAPSSASTTRPESSAKAGSLAAVAAATALSFAFAANVSPVSSGSPRPSSLAEIAVTPCGDSNSRISANLPGLWVAITSWPLIRRGMSLILPHRHLLQVHKLGDALLRQGHQRQELILRERRLLRRALHLDDSTVTGHDEIGVGLGV